VPVSARTLGRSCGVCQRVDTVEPESRSQREARFERKNFLDDHMYSTTGDVYAKFGDTEERLPELRTIYVDFCCGRKQVW
jgi:hypothetical protein